MKPGHWLGAGAVLALSLAGAATGALLAASSLSEPAQHHKLARVLDEISGLATTADGRLLAHEDQNGLVFELDGGSGKVTKSFTLGRELRGDFEGIASVDGDVYLVTSTGKLVRGREGAHGEEVEYEVFDTAVAERCLEVEGLGYDPNERQLLLACKQARGGAHDVLLFRWSVDRQALSEPVWRTLANQTLRRPGGRGDFRPSGVARDPASGHWLLLSGSPPAVAELTADGELVGVRWLDEGRHRQPEGITMARGTLWIADEGAGKRARLSAYDIGDEAQ